MKILKTTKITPDDFHNTIDVTMNHTDDTWKRNVSCWPPQQQISGRLWMVSHLAHLVCSTK